MEDSVHDYLRSEFEAPKAPKQPPELPPEAEQRLRQAHTFLTTDEKEKLKRLAWRTGMSQSGYLRMLLNAVDE